MAPTFKNRPSELVTTTDGKKIYNSRSVAVVMVLGIKHKDNIYYAVQKRGNREDLSHKGLWCLPCGYLDWDENSTEAVMRELWEEMGIDLDDLNTECNFHLKGTNFLHDPWFVKTETDENRQNVVLYHGIVYEYFKFDLPKFLINAACEGDEVAEAKWIQKRDLYEYKWAFDHGMVLSVFNNKYVDCNVEVNKPIFGIG